MSASVFNVESQCWFCSFWNVSTHTHSLTSDQSNHLQMGDWDTFHHVSIGGLNAPMTWDLQQCRTLCLLMWGCAGVCLPLHLPRSDSRLGAAGPQMCWRVCVSRSDAAVTKSVRNPTRMLRIQPWEIVHSHTRFPCFVVYNIKSFIIQGCWILIDLTRASLWSLELFQISYFSHWLCQLCVVDRKWTTQYKARV